METMIRTVNVKRCFPIPGGSSFYALKGINIEVPRSSLTILKGRSGSGKTTLLNIIGALDKPSEGQVFLDGREISSLSENHRDRIRRRDIGFVFQSVTLIPMMTAYENVEYALRLGKYAGNRKERVEECLRWWAWSEMRHMPQELWGGEQQRVAIARAIAHKPKVIFADEPTGELDSNTSLQVMKIFRELIDKEGITIVMTTHDTGLMTLGDVVYEVEDGEIINGSL
jgi:putative ABC transport system ATP-binding protein